ncbi:hypothetical protein PG985_007833 [Apiospora marii]|uniref:Uncharacterized protein n=1 Tax=Apiospora marii TaxID=335849 RepID=A0ABR1SQ42_9PEZI
MSIFELPSELRSKTYENLVVSDHPIGISFEQTLALPGRPNTLRPRNVEAGNESTRHLNLSLLRINHHDRKECVKIFYSRNTFSFPCNSDLSDLYAQLDSFRLAYGYQASLIRHIVLPFPAFAGNLTPRRRPPSVRFPEYPDALRTLKGFWTGMRQITFTLRHEQAIILFQQPESVSDAAVDRMDRQFSDALPEVKINVDVGDYRFLLFRDRAIRLEQESKMANFISNMELFQGWNVLVERT